MSDPQQWYVVYTKPRQEAVAIDNLVRQGYTIYCPQTVQAKRRRRHWQKVIEPLFPRYLFMRLAAGLDDFAPIRSTLGVVGLLRFGTKPAVMPQPAIDAIQRQERAIISQAGVHPNWKSGDEVEIIDGPFASLKGVFQASCSTERVLVLLNMLGRENPVAVNADDIIPA